MGVAQADGGQAGDRALPDGLFRYVWRESRAHQPWLCLLAGAVSPQLQGGLNYALRWYRGLVGERAIRRLRWRVQQTPRHGAAGDGAEAGRGESVSIVSIEVERVGGFIGASLSEPVLQVGIFASVLGCMLAVQPVIALVSLAFFVPRVIFVPLLQRAANRPAKPKVQLVREFGTLLLLPEDDQGVRYRDRLDRVYRSRRQYYALKFLIKFLNNLLNHLAPLSVLRVGGYLVIGEAATIGTLVAFISGFRRLADPSRELLAHCRLVAETRVQYRLIAGWLAD